LVRALPFLLLVPAAAALLSGCSAGRDTSSRTQQAPTATVQIAPPHHTQTTVHHRPPPASTATGTTPDSRTVVTVFLLRDGALTAVRREVPHTLGVARASLEQLLAGPTSAESQDGLTTAIPAGTALRGVTLADGTITVDVTGGFSSSAGDPGLRVAQVVYTATQFATVHDVQLELDGAPLGSPQGRADLDQQAPQILLDTPTAGQQASCPLRVAGSADTPEGALTVELRGSDGGLLLRKDITASSGTGVRGSFETTLRCHATGAATLTVYALSEEDGAPTHRTVVQLTLG
jgi:hypothetical protein